MNGMRQKTLGEPSSQTWATEGRGEALDAEAKEAEPLMAKPATESPALASAEAQLGRTAVVRTRMPGGVGGVASRGVPLSRSYCVRRATMWSR
jgi:hypothetical protein